MAESFQPGVSVNAVAARYRLSANHLSEWRSQARSGLLVWPARDDVSFSLAPLVVELLSSLVFEGFGSCGDLVGVCGFNSVFERDACDDFGEVVKAA